MFFSVSLKTRVARAAEELQSAMLHDAVNKPLASPPDRADVPEDELRANWFSSQSVEDVYYTYLELDQDHGTPAINLYDKTGLDNPNYAEVRDACMHSAHNFILCSFTHTSLLRRSGSTT